MRILFLTALFLAFSTLLFSNNDDRKLPLIDFTVVQNGMKTDIKWSLGTAPFGTFFTIEKSTDGKNFSKLIDLPVSENGNVYEEYFETDYQPHKGVSFYRIKQTDEEGNAWYSDITFFKYREEESQRQGAGISKQDASLLSAIKSAEGQESLFVLRDLDGHDHYAKVQLGQEDNYLFALTAQPELPTGIYRIVGASNNQLYSLKVVIK